MSRFDRKPTNAAEKPPTEAPAPAQLDPDHIDASNEGFKMLKSMGWTEGEGLGKASKGDALPLSERIKEEARREGLGRATQEAEMLSKATTRKRDDSDDEDAKRRRQEVGEEQRRRDEVLAEQHRNFYCACCDKQYTTVSEFSAHLSSYDHHHRKRFAEMREVEKARNADATAEKRSREEARRERELQKQIRAAAAAAPAPAPAPAPASTGYATAPLPGFSGFQTKKIAGAAPIKFSLDFGKKL